MNRELLHRSASVATQASPTNTVINANRPGTDKIYPCGAGPSIVARPTSNDSLFSSSDTSDRISKLLLSSPVIAAYSTTSSTKQVQSERQLYSSSGQQMHTRKASSSSSHPSSEKYRRAAQSLGLLFDNQRNIAAAAAASSSISTSTTGEVPKGVLVAHDKTKIALKRWKHKVSISKQVRVVVIERLSAADSMAMHTSNEEALELQKGAIHTAKTLRHLTKQYGHDAASLRAHALRLQVDTCVRGIEHFLSKELFRERATAQMRHVDAVLDTQHRYRQYIHNLSQAHASSSPTHENVFVETMAGDIAKASKSSSRTAVLDAINRAVDDEVAARSGKILARSG